MYRAYSVVHTNYCASVSKASIRNILLLEVNSEGLMRNRNAFTFSKLTLGPLLHRYMISVIQYGGRITDEFDELLMNTYAEKYFHQGVIAEHYELYKDERSGFAYQVPIGTEIECFRNAIEQLPGQESPEIFGMHPNADLTFRALQVT